MNNYRPSKQECDAFRMKVISLLKEKKGMYASSPTLLTILKAPIDAVVIPQNERTCEIRLSQRFGDLRFEGHFLKFLKDGHSIPLRHSFKLHDCN
jgi:hypothetical protein